MRLPITMFIALRGAGLLASPLAQQPPEGWLLTPRDPAFAMPAPAVSHVRLDTTKGLIVIEVTRAWAPLGAGRFINFVRHGYYDDTRVFRVRPQTGKQEASFAEENVFFDREFPRLDRIRSAALGGAAARPRQPRDRAPGRIGAGEPPSHGGPPIG